jgi:hypothetical protein
MLTPALMREKPKIECLNAVNNTNQDEILRKERRIPVKIIIRGQFEKFVD